MSEPKTWAEVVDNARRISREHPTALLSLTLAPVRLGLMVGAVRACTGSTAARSLLALVCVWLVWSAVEIGVDWVGRKPGEDAPGKPGSRCDPARGIDREWVTLCDRDPEPWLHDDWIDDSVQIMVGRCHDEDCGAPRVPCSSIVILRIGHEELGRGPWYELRQTEAAQEFLRRGGGTAEQMMRQVDAVNGTGRP